MFKRIILLLVAVVIGTLFVNYSFAQTKEYTFNGDYGTIKLRIPSDWQRDNNYSQQIWETDDAAFSFYTNTDLLDIGLDSNVETPNSEFQGYPALILIDKSDDYYVIIVFDVGNEPAVGFIANSAKGKFYKYIDTFTAIFASIKIFSKTERLSDDSGTSQDGAYVKVTGGGPSHYRFADGNPSLKVEQDHGFCMNSNMMYMSTSWHGEVSDMTEYLPKGRYEIYEFYTVSEYDNHDTNLPASYAAFWRPLILTIKSGVNFEFSGKDVSELNFPNWQTGLPPCFE